MHIQPIHVHALHLCTRAFSRSFSSGMDDDFKPQVKVSEEDEIVKIIKEDVKSPVFVYMKGTPDAPQCGFSMQVVRILQYLGVSFQSRNVLEAAALRETVKTFSYVEYSPSTRLRFLPSVCLCIFNTERADGRSQTVFLFLPGIV